MIYSIHVQLSPEEEAQSVERGYFGIIVTLLDDEGLRLTPT
jgi:hypothetical protein